MFARSTNLLLAGSLMGSPILWIDNPQASMGSTLFLIVATVAIALIFAGFSYWAIDRK